MLYQILKISFLLLIFISCSHKSQKTYHTNGKIMEEFTVNKKGEKDGTYSSFYDSGLPYETAEYKNGKLKGVRKLNYPEGVIEIIENYNENGELHGPYQTFYKNGQLWTDKHYSNNILNGDVKVYYQNGNLKEVVSFRDNQENGNFIEYFENGKIQWKGAYLNGPNEFGELEEYDSTGLLIKKMICDSFAICRSTWKIDNYDLIYKSK
jgi:antitoxin component YwqK of YwqJK toxin-antitoxin module